MSTLFVAYTLGDLKVHGARACELALGHGWQVVDGTEFVDAASRREQVQQCDAFLVLSAFFYGDAEGPASVESLWNVAGERNLPRAALLLREDASWPLNKVHKTPALLSFREGLRKERLAEWFREQPDSLDQPLTTLLSKLESGLRNQIAPKKEEIFVVWDFTIQGLGLILAGLEKRPPENFSIRVPGLPHENSAGEIFKDIVLDGIRKSDRVLVITDKPNANVAFEAGLALGFGKPMLLARFGAKIPDWLQESAFKGFVVKAIQNLDQLRSSIADHRCWFNPQKSTPVPVTGRTLCLAPSSYVGSALREELRAKCPHWKEVSANGFQANDLGNSFSDVAQMVWCIASYSDGTDERDGAENSANGLVFGWFFARALKLNDSPDLGGRIAVIRERQARAAVDVTAVERLFGDIEQFSEHVGDISRNDFRLSRYEELAPVQFGRAEYQMIELPALWPGSIASSVGVFPVSNRQFRSFCLERDYPMPDGLDDESQHPDLPVCNVTFDDAEAYAKWAGLELPDSKFWTHFSLTDKNQFRWWEDETLLAAQAWHAGNSGGRVHINGEKQANGFGLHDVLGNIWEWTTDKSQVVMTVYEVDTQVQQARVCGGSFKTDPRRLTTAREVDARLRDPAIGFRCVRLVR